MLTFTVTTSPALSMLLAESVAAVITTPVTVGATVSVVPPLFGGTSLVPEEDPPTAAPTNASAPIANKVPDKDAAPATPTASADAAPAFAISLAAGATEPWGTTGSGTVAWANKMGSISAAPAEEIQATCSVSTLPWGGMSARMPSKSSVNAKAVTWLACD